MGGRVVQMLFNACLSDNVYLHSIILSFPVFYSATLHIWYERHRKSILRGCRAPLTIRTPLITKSKGCLFVCAVNRSTAYIGRLGYGCHEIQNQYDKEI